MKFRFKDLVGRYRLVVSAELLAFIERAFVQPAAETAREAVRAEALHEAEGAEFEITADGWAISRSHDQEFYRVPLRAEDREYDDLRFEKAPAVVVILTLRDRDTLLAEQEGKPIAEFRRV
ncbi:MAG TPA: hypothetical protein VGP93_01635 [Polyangiaceae bacterium]|nr:hypothetical protein [Polyangiaceae bacterium]